MYVIVQLLALSVVLPTATILAGHGNCDEGLVMFVFPGRQAELSNSVVSVAVRRFNAVC